MEIRVFAYLPIDSRMYVMAVGGKGIIIDPNISEEAFFYLRDNQVREVIILLTHEHYDHISGVNWWRDKYPCQVICSKACKERVGNPSKNLSRHYEVLFLFKPEAIREQAYAQNVQPFACEADIGFVNQYSLELEGHQWVMTETPGHSEGSCCIMLDDKYCFTGDSLLGETPVITRLPGGSKLKYLHTKETYLDKLDDTCVICPGHGDMYIKGSLNNNQ